MSWPGVAVRMLREMGIELCKGHTVRDELVQAVLNLPAHTIRDSHMVGRITQEWQDHLLGQRRELLQHTFTELSTHHLRRSIAFILPCPTQLSTHHLRCSIPCIH